MSAIDNSIGTAASMWASAPSIANTDRKFRQPREASVDTPNSAKVSQGTHRRGRGRGVSLANEAQPFNGSTSRRYNAAKVPLANDAPLTNRTATSASVPPPNNIGSTLSDAGAPRKPRRRGRTAAEKRKASLAPRTSKSPAKSEPKPALVFEKLTVVESDIPISETPLSPIPPPARIAAEEPVESTLAPPSVTSIRPSTPASHRDWADEDDEDDLPDLDDWGITPGKPRRRSSAAHSTLVGSDAPNDSVNKSVLDEPVVSEPAVVKPVITETIHTVTDSSVAQPTGLTPNIVAAVTPMNPSFAHEYHPIDEVKPLEQKRRRSERNKEHRAAPKKKRDGMTVGELSNREPNAPRDLAARIGGYALEDHKSQEIIDSISSLSIESRLSRSGSTTDLVREANESPSTSAVALDAFSKRRPFSGASIVPPLSSSRKQGGNPFDRSLDAPPERPFHGGRSLNNTNAPRGGHRRKIGHQYSPSQSRPVISPNALNQLTKSLSGGSRTHRASAVTAE